VEKEILDNEQLDKMLSNLRAYEDNQNKVDIEEFMTYSKLFKNIKVDRFDEDIKLLANAFTQRFNPYKPVEVFDNGKLIFRVPQLFIPIKEVSEDYTHFVTNFKSNGNSEIPKYAAEATEGLLLAILKSQNQGSPGDRSYINYIKDVKERHDEAVTDFVKLKSNLDDLPSESSAKDSISDIDGIDGLSWE